MGKKLQAIMATAVVLLLAGLAPQARALDLGPIISGQTRSGTITAPGGSDVYSFTYAAGDVVVMKGAHPTNRRLSTEIRDPGNQSVLTFGCSGNSSASFTLPATGTYTATVKSCDQNYTGAYAFTFIDITAGPLRDSVADVAYPQEGGAIVSGQTVTGYTAMGDLDVFLARVDPGEWLVVSVTKLSGGPNPLLWLLPPSTAPDPSLNKFSGPGDRQEIALTTPGTYTIVMQSEDTNKVGDYFLTLQKIPGACADCYSALPDSDGGLIPAAPTASVAGSIVRATDMDAWQFYATVPETATITLSREMRLSLYAPTVLLSREFGPPVYSYLCGALQTTHNVTLPTNGFYELLVEECLTGAGGAYTLDLTLPAQTAPPPLANPAPAACGPIDNVFAPGTLGWDRLPAATTYQIYTQEADLLGPILPLGSVAQPPSGRAEYALPYQQLQTGNVYHWYVEAWDTFDFTYSPTYSFGFFCTPTVTVTPAALDFGYVQVGTTSAPVTVTITNTGTCYEDPRVASVPSGFSVAADTCTTAPAGGHLAPGGSCSLAVAFTPASEGPHAGGLALAGFLPEAHDGIVDLAGEGVLADLQVVQVSDPAQPNPDGTFSFTDTTRNTGAVPVPASVTGYRLSLDQKISRLDPAFALTRAVPALTTDPDPGHVSTGTVTLTVPADTPRGTYYVAACADGDGAIGELNETNNCRLSKTTIRVEPDLLVTAVSDPPAAGTAGTTFSVTDTTRNSGLVTASASGTRYRLSLDTTITTTDTLLTGSRPVPALGVGATSTGTVTLTVPATAPQGTFYLAACADDAGAVPEGSETNNCRVSATTIGITRPNLQVSAVGNPPAAGVAGTSFTATDTTLNGGAAGAAATTTSYRLSLDTAITGADPQLTGSRDVPALAAAATSSGSATVTVPATVAPGSYYLGACADSKNKATETVETDNCLRSATRITISSPDLRVSAVSNPPATGTAGGSFSVTDTTLNASATVGAAASTTSYRLTADTAVSTADPQLTGTRAVPALGAGASSAGSATVTIPDAVSPGVYYLAACADDARAVAESDENNNCRVSSTTLTLQKADLAVSAVSNPPAAGVVGTTFTVDDTTANGGAVAAGASTTRYRLSPDATITGSDPLLTGMRAVPGLGVGAASAGSGTVVTIPASVPAGTFYLGACADDAGAVSESDETNNCRGSATQITVTKADLRVTSVSEPPQEGDVGLSFEVTDVTANQGLTPAAASATRYRLSLDATITAADPLLTGTRSVPALGVGGTSAGTVTVTIPDTVVQGSYYLGACADGAGAVPESNENNNCAVSTGTLDVLNADLRVTAVSEPPAEGFVGTIFSVTDTTTNAGAAPTGKVTTNRYRLSSDADITTADPLLTGTRTVGSLASGAASTGTAALTIPATIAQGVYHLGACADDTGAVTEGSETNNCRASAGTIWLKKPDLQVTALSEPPAEGFVGTGFPVTETTANLGLAAAAASTTRYRLSLDATITTADPLLTGTRAAGALGVGAASTGTVTLTIPAVIAQGIYRLAACADDAAAVSESDDKNNCRVSAGTISLKKPDLLVTAVSNPPAGGTAGTSFLVTDTTENAGLAAAAATTTGYRLSLDATITSADPQLTGTRAAGAIGVGAASTGAVTVTVPGAIAEGTYYLGACADDSSAVSESNEANNCFASTTTIELRKADLRISALSDPPAAGTVGATFSATDTTENTGLAAAGASTTRYRFSLDTTITGADPLLTGTRAAGALGIGAASTGSVTLTIPAAIPQGVYHFAACADDEGVVAESDEADNCLVAAGTIDLAKADLRVSAVSDPPAEGTIGAFITITDTTTNAGTAPSVPSTTRYRISTDATISTSDPVLAEFSVRHAVPALAPGENSTAGIAVAIPVLAQGSYYIGACADEGNLVSESAENNNCRAAAGQIFVKLPDLAVTAVSDPPATGLVGTAFSVTDTTADNGLAPAGASTTRYRLTVDATVTTTDPLLTGTRAVAALAVGAASTGTVTVTIPASVPQGTFWLAACADDAGGVPESDETNNCRLSATTIDLRKPDLRASAVTNPPAEGTVGASFGVTDTTENAGLAAAGASTTRYRLSLDTTITSADTLLTGTRAVAALAIGAASTGTVTLTIPALAAQGLFYLAACADDAAAVSESSESNNCFLSTTRIQVKKPDLRATAVSDPPATGVVGTSFSVTDTTTNLGAALAAAGASTTRFRLSTDTTVSTSDPLLTGERAVAALAVGEASSGSTVVTVPATVAEGTYYLAACADDASAVAESSESNNCFVSATQIQLRRADLRVTAVSDPPAEGAAGTSFGVSDTTENRSGALTGASPSVTRYRLSTDATVTTADPLLTGERAVAALAVGEASAGGATVTIPATVPQGTYYLAACADDTGVVPESDEANNCRVSAGQIFFKRPDLTVTAVNDPPAAVDPGGSFLAGDTTANGGLAAAAASTTQYRLSLDATITTADILLTGTRAVAGLAVGAASAGTATVTVPANALEGDYYLGACADGTAAVPESSETNNCRASATTVGVWKPDLAVTSVSAPPAEATAGYSSFDVTDTTANVSTHRPTVWNTVTQFYLSLDQTVTAADLPLGSSSVPALAAGASATATTTVSVSVTAAEGLYWLFACADGAGVIAESSEANCTRAATQVQVWKPDLGYALQGGVPSVLYPGMHLTVDGTVTNGGGGHAPGPSFTYFRLSADTTIDAGDSYFHGNVSSSDLAPGASHAASVALIVPYSMSAGTYYVAGCADTTGVVAERNETNNCGFWGATVQVRRPDLAVTAVTDPPASGRIGTSFTVSDTTLNSGAGTAVPTTTTYRLSANLILDAADPVLTGNRAVPALDPGLSSIGTMSVSIPAVTLGNYYLLACADGTAAVSEELETNNCRASTTRIAVQAALPDLTVTSVSDPPATVDAGAIFFFTDEVRNLSPYAGSAASLTRQYLSADAVKDAGDHLLSSPRNVPALAALGTSTATVAVIVATTVPAGTYWLLSCADGAGTIAEGDETNNCLAAATQVQVRQPDLTLTVEPSYSPDWTLSPGEVFNQWITVTNSGTAGAGATTSRFYLVTDMPVTGADPRLGGVLNNTALAAGASQSNALVTLTLPSSPPVPEGTYYLAGCADDLQAVAESNEVNNCGVGGTFTVRWANLTVSQIISPPTAFRGADFTVEDRVVNNAAFGGDASAFEVSLRLSTDTTITSGDLLLGSHPEGGLAAGLDAVTDTILTLPMSVAPGFYYLGVCADSANSVPETNEADNCVASPSAIEVLPQVDFSSSVDSGVPTYLYPGQVLSISATAHNGGLDPGISSTSRFRLSTDATIDMFDYLLTGSQTVPSLSSGGTFAFTASLMVPATIPRGSYFLAACADDGNFVPELNEDNNCAIWPAMVTLSMADLTVLYVNSYPATVTRGVDFSVNSQIYNNGDPGGDATSYYLQFRISTDSTITTADTLINGLRLFPGGTPAGGSTSGPTLVNVPAGVTPGTYYLGVCADATGMVPETNETNNCGAGATTIVVQ